MLAHGAILCVFQAKDGPTEADSNEQKGLIQNGDSRTQDNLDDESPLLGDRYGRTAPKNCAIFPFPSPPPFGDISLTTKSSLLCFVLQQGVLSVAHTATSVS